jgi:predicted membrane metal-binding protein
MGIISIGAVLYGRKTMALYSLFLSAIIMLIFNFEWLQSISFQLSFSATLGIVLFGSMEPVDVIPAIPPVIPAIPPVIPAKAGISRSPTHRQLAVLEDDKHCHSEFISESLQEKILKQVQDDKESLQDDKFIILKSKFLHLKSYFIEELRISFAAQVFTVPLIFWYFRQVSMVSPLANILVAWLIAPIMILGMITIALGFVSWKLGFVFSWLVYPLLAFIVWVVEVLAKVPFGSIKV